MSRWEAESNIQGIEKVEGDGKYKVRKSKLRGWEGGYNLEVQKKINMEGKKKKKWKENQRRKNCEEKGKMKNEKKKEWMTRKY